MKELKWGKNVEKCWVRHILWSSKILFCFWSEAYIFFQMVIFATLFRRCPLLWKSTLKMTTLFRRCLTFSVQHWKRQRCFNVVLRCKFQRWYLQRCFNDDLMLCDAATSYQPKNNVEQTLKCLLGVDIVRKLISGVATYWYFWSEWYVGLMHLGEAIEVWSACGLWWR